MSEIATKGAPDRAEIAIEDDEQVKYWIRHLAVSLDELQRAIEKVGNSAASIRKELARIEAQHPAPSGAGC